MTISEILALVDDINPNTYDEKIKINWLSELDNKIFTSLVMTCEHVLVDDGEGNLVEPTFTAYTEDDEEKELIAPNEFADIYRYYLATQIEYSNGETDRYNNSMLMFNSAYDAFERWYVRNHKSFIKPLRVF